MLTKRHCNVPVSLKKKAEMFGGIKNNAYLCGVIIKKGTDMTTMTLNIHNNNILESLKQVLSNMVGVEIASVDNPADDQDETEYISSSAAMMRVIEKGDAEIAEGKGTKIAVEDLWK